MNATEKSLYGGHISKLIFNDNTALDILSNDIVVFVGPNNAGKSQSLRDIYELCNKKISPVVISDIMIEKNTSSIDELLDDISFVQNNGDHKTYQGLNYSFNTYNINQYPHDSVKNFV